MFGIISSTTEPFCSDCDRSRLTADGMWYLCLYATRGIDLRGRSGPAHRADDLAADHPHSWEARPIAAPSNAWRPAIARS